MLSVLKMGAERGLLGSFDVGRQARGIQLRLCSNHSIIDAVGSHFTVNKKQ